MGARLAAAALAACLLPAAPPPAGPAREAAKLASARDRWQAQRARDYTYRLRLACFCVQAIP